MSRRLLILTILFLLPFLSHAQNIKAPDTIQSEEPIEEFTDEDPVFPGKIEEYTKANLKYPSDSNLKFLPPGYALVSFIVEKDGRLSDLKIERSYSPECDAEAIRFVQNMPAWLPAKLEGKPVRVKHSLTVTFKRAEPIAAPDKIEQFADEEAMFPGNLDVYIYNNLVYPEDAKSLRTQGKVTATFIVEADGKITNIKLKKTLSWVCDQEVLQLIKWMPDWIPAVKNGIAVRSSHSLTINFSLTERSSRVYVEY